MSSTNRGGKRNVSDYYITPQPIIKNFLFELKKDTDILYNIQDNNIIDLIEEIYVNGKYGKKHVDGFFHLHNLEGGTFGRYSFLEDTNIFIKINGEQFYIPMESLFEKYNSFKESFGDTEIIEFNKIHFECRNITK